MPSKYSYENLVIRSLYFSICGLTWLFSSVLVYFDYSRRLPSEWRGQRSFWVLGVLSNSLLLAFNLVFEMYDFSKKSMFQFDLIQIAAYVLTILLCILLTFYAVFLPNDFSMISPDLYTKLKKSTYLDETKSESQQGIKIKTSIIGYKVKEVKNARIVYFTIFVNHSSQSFNISRTLADFEALDLALRQKFSKIEFPNLSFPDFSAEDLRKVAAETRVVILNSYLSELCVQEFITPDLLNFLQIEGHARDLIEYRNSIGLEEKLALTEEVIRSESSISPYFNPSKIMTAPEENKQHHNFQSIISVSIPTCRVEESESIEYFIKTKVISLNIKKIKPSKYKEICEIHKNIRKSVSPAKVHHFPSRNYSKSLKKNDKEADEQRKKQVEYYFSVLLNDPAYICEEILEFFGFGFSPSDLYPGIPRFSYRLLEGGEWQGELSDDSSHFISFSFMISKSREAKDQKGKSLEVPWKISKRYREFDAFHSKLVSRHSSPHLRHFLMSTGKGFSEVPALPVLPSKTISPPSTLQEINERRRQLFCYLSDLLNHPEVTCCYWFREFIEDKQFE
jgi:hypothetical protein